MTAMLTISSTGAPRCRIRTGFDRPIRIGPNASKRLQFAASTCRPYSLLSRSGKMRTLAPPIHHPPVHDDVRGHLLQQIPPRGASFRKAGGDCCRSSRRKAWQSRLRQDSPFICRRIGNLFIFGGFGAVIFHHLLCHITQESVGRHEAGCHASQRKTSVSLNKKTL